MVRIPFGQKVVTCVLLGTAVVVFAVGGQQHAKPLYIATDDASDLMIVDGMAKAQGNIVPSVGTLRALVVPHHLVAAEAIALGIKPLASSSPRLVVVVSPDHFGRCPTLACTTPGSYETFFGTLSISDDGVARALSHTTLFSSSDLFSNEHGVSAIVPFIKQYVPQAQILPIVLSQRGVGSKETRAELVGFLHELLTDDVALVVSTDFSHYLPMRESDGLDEKTQSAFCSGAHEELLRLNNPNQSDCPLCLWLLRSVAQNGGYWNPVRLWHSNSARLMRDLTAAETTSHFVFHLRDTNQAGRCEGPIEQ